MVVDLKSSRFLVVVAYVVVDSWTDWGHLEASLMVGAATAAAAAGGGGSAAQARDVDL